jgi:hypothetical protein
MKFKGKALTSSVGLSLISSSLIFTSSPTAAAATLTATGADAAICNQEVSSTSNVTAVRLAGGDCVITFTAGVTTWTPARNLKTIRILLVGGGGGGGGSYDTTGSGGGGAGQVLAIDSRRVTTSSNYEIGVGSGGAAGFHIARTNSTDAIGLSGSSTSIALDGVNLHIAYGGGGGGSSRANGPGTVTRTGGAAATLSAGGIGGGAAGGGYSGGGGGGSAGAGGNGSTSSPGAAVAGGSGTPINISGSSVTYGIGGAGGVQNGSTSSAGTNGTANTGNGGGGASVHTGTFRNGGAGGSGVVIIRYSTTVPVFSNLSISGNPTTAIVRAANTISATVDVPSLITFFAGKNRVAGCISLPTTGSGSNNVATCSWKPTLKGAQIITAEAAPVAAGLAGTSTFAARIAVIARSTRR